MKELCDRRTRWDQLSQMYILTTPISMIFSYKQLKKDDPLEANLISMLKPINDGNGTLILDPISKRFKSYLDSEGLIDMGKVKPNYFIEKLNCVADDMEITEEHIQRLTDSFDSGKGFQLNRGRVASV